MFHGLHMIRVGLFLGGELDFDASVFVVILQLLMCLRAVPDMCCVLK